MLAWGGGLCSSALNCVLPIDNHVFATGDDDGGLKVWDLRKGDAILEARQQEEYISAMAVDSNGKILLTARYGGLHDAGVGLPCAHAGSWGKCPAPCPMLTACPFHLPQRRWHLGRLQREEAAL